MSVDYNIEVKPEVFNSIYLPHLHNPRPTEIFYGGSSSGKSNFVAHRVILDIMSGGHNYLCIRKVGNTLGKSVLNELYKAIVDMGVMSLFRIVPSQGHITCVNDYQILFAGMDDPEKVKSITPRVGVFTDVWYEEATEAAYEDIKQLRKRLRGRAIYAGKEILKRIVLSFNPIFKTHWIVKEFFTQAKWSDNDTYYESDDIRILKTTYKDNRFLTVQDCKALEDEKDPYWYEVYTLGNWGILGTPVFTNWRVEDIDELIPGFDNIKNGLDFGFTNDPTAYTRSHYQRNKNRIYIFQEFNEKGLTNPAIAALLKPIVNNEIVWADSAEPKSIQELNDNGINARGVKKGKDSIWHGIQWLKQQEIIVSHHCQEVINELTLYQWDKDKDGESINTPVDKHNHHMDGLRYSYESEHGGMFYSGMA